MKIVPSSITVSKVVWICQVSTFKLFVRVIPMEPIDLKV